MKKLLVTGASGFLGWNLCQLAQSQWQVYGTFGTQRVELPSTQLYKLDMQDYDALKALVQSLQPDAVIHCAARSSPNWCQQNPETSYAINVTASVNLAGLCSDLQIPCAFTSTDQVFDGRNAPYQESDPVCPINRYGEEKVAAEQGMQACYPQVAICRMPLMFGAAGQAKSFLQPFLETLRSNQTLKLFTDEFRTPVSALDAASGLLLALATVQGPIHLGGQERVSRYDFGQILVKEFGFLPEQIQACRQADVQMAAPRPADVSLDSTQAFRLGYQPLRIQDALHRLKDQL
jgi:dTDP-4-dehydrorhamnose reductase